MRAGPKAAVDPSKLPFESDLEGSARLAAWCERFIRVPKGTGARESLVLRPWQQELVGSVLDAPTRPRTAGWMLPRGQGKSSLMAAWAVYELLEGPEGASIVVAATDERQAGIVFNTARRMIELNDELESRVQVFKTELRVPDRGATFQVLPAEAKRLEGLDFTLAILDEAGVIGRDTYEVVALASGKREESTVVAIGTPGPDPFDNVLADMRAYAGEHPEDETFVWREHSAAEFPDHPPDCRHCWQVANPALGDFLHEDALRALLPPKTREATFRRARLCQLISESTGGFLPPGVWEALSRPEGIPDGAEVIVSLDGSFSDDTTALVIGTVGTEPHFDLLGVWAPTGGERVPISDVEDAIREAGKRYRIRELVGDPFRWARTLQILADEGVNVVEFPWSPSRITAATSDLYSAAINGRMSHTGHPTLAAHVNAAVIREDARGIRLDKTSRKATARKIDAAAALLMCHSRAVWAATNKPKRRRVASARR